MEYNPQISIIVPVYKVEKYLEHCVNSILNQTFDDFELILVDDGSPDGCPQRCDEMAKKDNRIIVIHKTNGGLSDARNKGIDIAKGKYIAFVDSDDYIACDMYEKLYNNLKQNNADIAMCRAHNIYDDDFEHHKYNEGEIRVFLNDDILKALYSKKLDNFAWNKLYKRELFQNIRYPYGKIYEDLFTTYKLLDLSNCVVTDASKMYYYRIRKDSIMGKARRVINVDKFEAFAEIEKHFKDRTHVLNMAFEYACNDLMSDVFKVIGAQSVKENKPFFDELKLFVKQHRLKKSKAGKVLWLATHALWILKLRYSMQKLLRRIK